MTNSTTQDSIVDSQLIRFGRFSSMIGVQPLRCWLVRAIVLGFDQCGDGYPTQIGHQSHIQIPNINGYSQHICFKQNMFCFSQGKWINIQGLQVQLVCALSSLVLTSLGWNFEAERLPSNHYIFETYVQNILSSLPVYPAVIKHGWLGKAVHVYPLMGPSSSNGHCFQQTMLNYRRVSTFHVGDNGTDFQRRVSGICVFLGFEVHLGISSKFICESSHCYKNIRILSRYG